MTSDRNGQTIVPTTEFHICRFPPMDLINRSQGQHNVGGRDVGGPRGEGKGQSHKSFLTQGTPYVLLMDQFEYIKILKEVMLPYAEVEMPLKWVFQQDNNPKHTSKRAESWFQTNKINIMEWQAQSPDLNPIETCGVTSKMLFLRQNQEMQRNCGM